MHAPTLLNILDVNFLFLSSPGGFAREYQDLVQLWPSEVVQVPSFPIVIKRISRGRIGAKEIQMIPDDDDSNKGNA
ncbi:hypothetical protein VNO77_27313 [Canavalia gladiata]|uniref:Uncharacterized protein n=1 Tax=Canavalia gladiata TaxID=3824 RepID=A0AAN9KX09_CANGL